MVVARNYSAMMTMVASASAALLFIIVGNSSFLLPTTNAFQIMTSSSSSSLSTTNIQRSSSLLHMATTGGNKNKSNNKKAPRFDKATEKWIITDPETQGPSAGYDLIGSLYRAGPVPFFQRVFNGDQYEQAVLKYMAKEGCDRIVSYKQHTK